MLCGVWNFLTRCVWNRINTHIIQIGCSNLKRFGHSRTQFLFWDINIFVIISIFMRFFSLARILSLKKVNPTRAQLNEIRYSFFCDFFYHHFLLFAKKRTLKIAPLFIAHYFCDMSRISRCIISFDMSPESYIFEWFKLIVDNKNGKKDIACCTTIVQSQTQQQQQQQIWVKFEFRRSFFI